MRKENDISKTFAFVLIVLTVFISSVSTWVLINQTMGSEPVFGLDRSIVRLNILKTDLVEPVGVDTDMGQARLYISQVKEVS